MTTENPAGLREAVYAMLRGSLTDVDNVMLGDLADNIAALATEPGLDVEPKGYAQVWTDGGGDPTFDELDGFLYRHFNARAVYIKDNALAATEPDGG